MHDRTHRREDRAQLRRMHNGTRRYNGRRYLRILIKLED
jgi:hypothetical protein